MNGVERAVRPDLQIDNFSVGIVVSLSSRDSICWFSPELLGLVPTPKTTNVRRECIKDVNRMKPDLANFFKIFSIRDLDESHVNRTNPAKITVYSPF
jgi:hypothetical protein